MFSLPRRVNLTSAHYSQFILTTTRYSHYRYQSNALSQPVAALTTTPVDAHYNSLFSLPEQQLSYHNRMFSLPRRSILTTPRNCQLPELGVVTQDHCSYLRRCIFASVRAVFRHCPKDRGGDSARRWYLTKFVFLGFNAHLHENREKSLK